MVAEHDDAVVEKRLASDDGFRKPAGIRADDENGVLLTAVYSATEEAPYGRFPHAFRITLSYTLDDGGLHQKTTVTNDSFTNMPVLLGFHTTFSAAFTETSRREDIRVYAELAEEYERNMANYLPTGDERAWDTGLSGT